MGVASCSLHLAQLVCVSVDVVSEVMKARALRWPCVICFAALVSASVELRSGAHLIDESELPLRTAGRRVVGRSGTALHLACVNLYGAHLKQMVTNGLDVQPLQNISARIVELGFNCVRLPFSSELVLTNRSHVPHPRQSLAANEDLQALTPLEVFDRTLYSLTQAGLLVILNNHVSSAGWCCSESDGEGLWYTTAYPMSAWLTVIELMGSRYRDTPLVAGFDLRNEVRPSALGVPNWGDGGRNDWSLAVLDASAKLNGSGVDMLVVVSGVHTNFLCNINRNPVHTNGWLLHRTVFTVHEYQWMSASDLLSGSMVRWKWEILLMFVACIAFVLLLWGVCDSRASQSRVGQGNFVVDRVVKTRWIVCEMSRARCPARCNLFCRPFWCVCVVWHPIGVMLGWVRESIPKTSTRHRVC